MSPSSPVSDAKSLLFFQFEQPLGTAAIATATFRRLREVRPDIRITVVGAGAPVNLVGTSPFVDEVISMPHPLNNTAKAFAFAATKLRSRRKSFDVAMFDTGNGRTIIVALAIAAGIPIRRGYCRRGFLLSENVAPNTALSNIENNLRLLEPLGVTPDYTEPAIHFSNEDLSHAEGLMPNGSGPRIAMITQTSKGHPNEWFDDRIVTLANSLIEKHDAQLIFVGAATDRMNIDGLRREIGAETTSIAGQTTPRQLAAALALCDLAVTVDTGGLHVARGVNLPTIVLANAAQPDNLWLPPREGKLHRVLLKDYVPCAVCWRHFCATRECMEEITVQEVADTVEQQLQSFPPGEQGREKRVAERLNLSLRQ